MMIFRGDMPSPDFEHGEEVKVFGVVGVIQHRRHNGRHWEYGVLTSTPFSMILWSSHPQRISKETQCP